MAADAIRENAKKLQTTAHKLRGRREQRARGFRPAACYYNKSDQQINNLSI